MVDNVLLELFNLVLVGLLPLTSRQLFDFEVLLFHTLLEPFNVVR